MCAYATWKAMFRMMQLLMLASWAAALLAVLSCGDEDSSALSGSPSPTHFCSPGRATASEIDIQLPRHGGNYTRHVPVEGWVDAGPGRLVSASVRGAGGGTLGLSQIEVEDAAEGELHRIEAVIVLQSLPEKL